MTYPGDGGLLQSYPDSLINLYRLGQIHRLCAPLAGFFPLGAQGKCALVILLATRTSFSLRVAQLTLSATSFGCFKAMTICWCISLGWLKIGPQFRCTGMASKAPKILSISPKEFSYLSSDSSSTSKHEVTLSANLSKTLTVESLFCVQGFDNLCSCRTKGSKLPNWMGNTPFVWHEMWFVSTMSSKSKIIVPSFSVMHFSGGWLTILW